MVRLVVQKLWLILLVLTLVVVELYLNFETYEPELRLSFIESPRYLLLITIRLIDVMVMIESLRLC